MHFRITTGLTATLYEGAAYGAPGVHLTLALMTGMGKVTGFLISQSN